MAIAISESTFKKTLDYLTNQSSQGSVEAAELLILWQAYLLPQDFAPIPDFSKILFVAWKDLADLQIGENCLSYPVPIADVAESMDMPIIKLIQHLETVEVHGLQLLPGRGINYLIRAQQVGDLTFHSALDFELISNKIAKNPFKVGDRVRVNAVRAQYTNQVGVIDQIISVSCRIKFDNGWVAFLPNHCLEKI